MKPELKLFFDFEFTSLSPDAQPISLGIVSSLRQRVEPMGGVHGYESKMIETESKSFYAEFSDFQLDRCDEWVKKNVVSKLRFNNEVYGKNHFEESHTEFGSYRGSGPLSSVKTMLKKWLEQFSEYNIQFVADCGCFDWYWMLQLLAEWEDSYACKEERYEKNGIKDCVRYVPLKTGLPKLPENISPVPEDLNDLIAIKKGISVREAFDIERLGSFCQDNADLYNNIPQTHNALFDARVIKATYEKLK